MLGRAFFFLFLFFLVDHTLQSGPSTALGSVLTGASLPGAVPKTPNPQSPVIPGTAGMS